MTYAEKSSLQWGTDAKLAYRQLTRGKVVTSLVAARGVVLQAAQELGIG